MIDVAVKAPKINLLTGTSAAIYKDFYKEAKTTLSFNHENVVKCLGFSKELDELPCLIFEFMSYGSLEVVLASNRTRNFVNQQQIQLTNVRSYIICINMVDVLPRIKLNKVFLLNFFSMICGVSVLTSPKEWHT